MTPGAVEMVPILRPAFARVRIANEIRMQFRRERKSGSTVSLQETLEADGESALTLADVLQDSFCMEECCEKKADLLRVRQLLETLPARERQILLLRYGLAGQPPLTQLETAQGCWASAAAMCPVWKATRCASCASIGTKNRRRSETFLLFRSRNPYSVSALAWISSSCSKVYSRFSASTSSFLERRGGRPSAFNSFALRSALPGLPESPHSYRSV